MKTPRSRSKSEFMVLGLLALLALPAPLPAAETGDLDGDGRVTIGDVVYLQSQWPPPGEFAPGSFEEILSFPCYHGSDFAYFAAQHLILFEAIRRAVSGSYPHWFPIARGWSEPVTYPPLGADPRLRVKVVGGTVPGGESDEAWLQLHLDCDAPVVAFAIVLDADSEVLQVPFHLLDWCPDSIWDYTSWREDNTGTMLDCFDSPDEPPVQVTPQAALIAGGRYVVTYGVPYSAGLSLAGHHEFALQARIPVFTSAGTYAVRVLEGSQAVLDDGTVVGFQVDGSATIEVAQDVWAGFDGRVPRLEFAPRERRILGRVEFRVVGADGKPGTESEPVADVYPGETFGVRVQMRTEVPLNEVYFGLVWTARAFACARRATNLFLNPEDGLEYQPHYLPPTANPCCDPGFEVGQHWAWWRLAGAWSHSQSFNQNYPDRVFECFRPLGEWTDLTELTLQVPSDAGSGVEVPLVFFPYERGSRLLSRSGQTGFAPYTVDWFCSEGPENWPPERLWQYDISYQSTFVRILGDNPPPPPPDFGLRVEIGDAMGRPGELVDVPVLVAADPTRWFFTMDLVVETDPAAVVVEGVDAWFQSTKSGDMRLISVPVGQFGSLLECVDEDEDGFPDGPCYQGIPRGVRFVDSDGGLSLIRWFLVGTLPLSDVPRELGRLKVRILDGAAVSRTLVGPGIIEDVVNGVPRHYETSIMNMATAQVAPATEFRAGTIRILGVGGGRFVRGDANADGKVDLSDAVRILAYLFLGQEGPPCLDSADTNDDAEIVITDAVYLLGVLFLGTGSLPAPNPDCGEDPGGADAIDCAQDTCE